MSTSQTSSVTVPKELISVTAGQPQVAGASRSVVKPSIRLTPRSVILLAAPATVVATMMVGYLILTTAGLPLYAAEMMAGAFVNTVGGLLAAIVLMLTINKGAAGVAQAGILGIGLRCGAVLVGILMAGMAVFGLNHGALVYWVMGYYFPLLIVESALVAWLSHRLPN